jgi:hypothetical protein
LTDAQISRRSLRVCVPYVVKSARISGRLILQEKSSDCGVINILIRTESWDDSKSSWLRGRNCCTRDGEAKGGRQEMGQIHDESRVECLGETLT